MVLYRVDRLNSPPSLALFDTASLSTAPPLARLSAPAEPEDSECPHCPAVGVTSFYMHRGFYAGPPSPSAASLPPALTHIDNQLDE